MKKYLMLLAAAVLVLVGMAAFAEPAGIPVVAVDADDAGSQRLAFAGTEPYQAGYQAGVAMVEGTGGTAKIAVLTSGVGSGGKSWLQPASNATRAQFATIISRYLQMFPADSE